MVDISGKVPKYDIALCEAISEALPKGEKITLLAANIDPKTIKCSSKKLISIVPKRFKNSQNKLKRALKALEGVINYLFLLGFIFITRPEVVHFQWLPFLEVSSIESIFLRLMKCMSPNTRFLLTVHNIFPHNSNEHRKSLYKERFAKVERFFCLFILHLQTSKVEFCNVFGIDDSRCTVIPHGVFDPGNVIVPHVRGEKLNLIMYGNQSYYKGTDILVDALKLLPKDCQERVHTTIVGQIDPSYYTSLVAKTKNIDIDWIPHFVPDKELYERINQSDVIVVPYREISQSGVLLLALAFSRPIICSDLPSFKETLVEYTSDMFFENGDVESLSRIIENTIVKWPAIELELSPLIALKKKLSWENIALLYLRVNKR